MCSSSSINATRLPELTVILTGDSTRAPGRLSRPPHLRHNFPPSFLATAPPPPHSPTTSPQQRPRTNDRPLVLVVERWAHTQRRVRWSRSDGGRYASGVSRHWSAGWRPPVQRSASKASGRHLPPARSAAG